MILPTLFIAPTQQMGRGVFTSAAVLKGTVLEIAPVIVMTAAERALLDQTALFNYIFEWPGGQEQCCMALGYVPVYNHAYRSNCEYEMDADTDQIHIVAMRDIEPGEELFINYNGRWDDEKPLWFDAK